jgi:hypothetical protein
MGVEQKEATGKEAQSSCTIESLSLLGVRVLKNAVHSSFVGAVSDA